MKSNFARCYPLIRASEGANDDDPDDPGGRTSRGITQREYDNFRRRNGLPRRDVWTASEAEIRAIYQAQPYWQVWGDRLPGGVDYVFFDMSVLQGRGAAVPILQRALGLTGADVDGRMGPKTMRAALAADPKKLVAAMTAARGEKFRAIARRRPTSKKYLRGWIKRANRVCDDALKLAG